MQKNNGVWAAAALSLSEVTRRPQLDAPNKNFDQGERKERKNPSTTRFTLTLACTPLAQVARRHLLP